MSPRTLRRKLEDEKTSFRVLLDELRMHVAIKYLRDTDLTIEAVAAALGFSDAANFRHAFRRWTKGSPQDFRAHFPVRRTTSGLPAHFAATPQIAVVKTHARYPPR